MNINFGAVLSMLPTVMGVVEKVQAMFGDQPGAERKKIAVDVAVDVAAVINGISAEQVINTPSLKATIEELVQISYDIMKLKQRAQAIEALLPQILSRDADGTGPGETSGAAKQ